MGRATQWSRVMLAAMLPFLVLGVSLLPAGPVNAEFCVEMPLLAAPAIQSQEQWRYTWDGAGGYGLVGWNPTEATLLVISQGCLYHTLGIVNIDLLSGSERWRITSNWLEGDASDSAAADNGVIILPTTEGIYAFDDSTGQQLWGYRHADEGNIPDIVAIANDIVVIAEASDLTGINIGTGTMAWEQALPVNRVSDWENIDGGPLVALGYSEGGEQNVAAFGLDKSTGALLWQTTVGQSGDWNGRTLELAGNGSGLIAAEILTNATESLVALDGATGAIRWAAPLVNDGTYHRIHMHITDGAQPTVVYATGGSREVKSATGYDAATGAVRWQNENIGTDAILADDTHLVGAGPNLSYMNALVLVDGETGEMVWAQHEAPVDNGFANSAQIVLGEVIFTPSMPKEAAPTITAIDLASGTVNWSSSYPEFARLDIVGTAAGIVLAEGSTLEETVLLGLAS